MSKVILIAICLMLSGCSVTSTQVQHRKTLKAMLEDGWELYVYDDKKLVLIKRTDKEFLVEDYFNTLNEE